MKVESYLRMKGPNLHKALGDTCLCILGVAATLQSLGGGYEVVEEAAKELRANEAFVKAAVKQNGMALESVSDLLKKKNRIGPSKLCS